jgi:hypothetical protein
MFYYTKNKHDMMQHSKKVIGLIGFLYSLLSGSVAAQNLFDISVGISNQDRFATQIAFRRQVSTRLRIGVEGQLGQPRYRFIDAKPITTGYFSQISLPTSVRLYESSPMRLDFFAKPGLRFQGVIDPDENDTRDSLLSSTTATIDVGLLATVMVSEKFHFQGGITFPTVFQLRPSSLFESNTTALHGSLSYRMRPNSIFFVKTQIGNAFGGDGDTQKFLWTLQTGVRFAIGKSQRDNPLVLEPSM